MEVLKMISFYEGQIADLLPSNITKDPSVQAVSYAVREGTQLLYRYTQLCYVYCKIDTMPDKILDLLSKELRTQYYSDSMDIDTKRALVRNSLIWYMTAGTPAAVEELVTVVFGSGEVLEWFEYGGEPYFFKIKTDTLITEENIMQFGKIIKKVKNTRSHMEAIELARKYRDILYIGGYLRSRNRAVKIREET